MAGADLFALIADQQIEIKTRHPLEPWRENFLASVGASYVVDPAAPPCDGQCGWQVCTVANPISNVEMDRRIAAMTGAEPEEAVTRCSFCPWQFEGPVEKGREFYQRHRESVHADTTAQQRSESENGTSRRGGRKPKWHRENALAAIQAFAKEHGRTPSDKDAREHELPNWPAAKRLFGSWPRMIEAAGLEPRQQKSSSTKQLVARAPASPPAPAPVVQPPADPEKIDVFALIDRVVTDSLIDFHEREAVSHQRKAEALRTIRQELEAVA